MGFLSSLKASHDSKKIENNLKKQRENAYRTYLAKAENGDAEACFSLAEALLLFSSDHSEICKWYKKAFNLGHAEAGYVIWAEGITEDGILKEGHSRELTEHSPLDEFRRSHMNYLFTSAERGCESAKFSLSVVYIKGEYVDRDLRKACALFEEYPGTSNPFTVIGYGQASRKGVIHMPDSRGGISDWVILKQITYKGSSYVVTSGGEYIVDRTSDEYKNYDPTEYFARKPEPSVLQFKVFRISNTGEKYREEHTEETARAVFGMFLDDYRDLFPRLPRDGKFFLNL